MASTPGRKASGGELLNIIDQRFAELEEQVALAGLVPQLHDRLVVMEKMMKQLEDQGFLLLSSDVDSDHHGPALPLASVEPVLTLGHPGPKWTDEAPVQLAGPEEGTENAEESIIDLKSLPAGLSPQAMAEYSPTRRRSSVEGLSHQQTVEMHEQLLDMQTQEYYSFGESTWDLVFFIGTGALGPLGSWQTFLLAVVNVLMQVVFVAIAFFNFTTPEVDETSVQEATRWRRSSGHSLSGYSSLSRESLAQRVCNLDKSLEQSGIQVALYENIERYLKSGREGFESYFTGQMLCIVALICWYLMVAKEVSHALALHRGIIAVPSGQTIIETRENPFTQVRHYKLKRVARRRKFFSLVLLLYRLFAAVLLVWVGTYFLVYTVSVTELILNAVALGIILDIDDLLFDALATTPGRHLVHQLDPLLMPSLPRVRGADAKSAFMTIAIPTLTLLVYFFMLAPMVDTLHDVSSAMCGGNKAFVWDLDRRGVVLLSQTVGGGWEDDAGIKNLAVQEAEEVGFGISQNDSKYGVWLQDVDSLSAATLLNSEEILDANNADCGDLIDGPQGRVALEQLRFVHQNQSIQGCQDALPFCSSVTRMPDFGLDNGRGWFTRMFCSASCGCRDPVGAINVQGCPYGQGRPCKQSSQFDQLRAELVCVEGSPEELRNSTDWASWVDAIRAYGKSTVAFPLKSEAVKIADAMWDHGCGFQANLSAEGVFWGDCFQWNSSFEWEFKTVEAFCPTTCQCGRAVESSSCPLPFGISCDRLGDRFCLTLNGRHYCPGLTPYRHATLFSKMATNDATIVDPLLPQIQAAHEETVRLLTGATDQLLFTQSSRLGKSFWTTFFFFEVDEQLNVTDIDDRITAANANVSEVEANLTEQLLLLSLPVDVLAFVVLRVGDGNSRGKVHVPPI